MKYIRRWCNPTIDLLKKKKNSFDIKVIECVNIDQNYNRYKLNVIQW